MKEFGVFLSNLRSSAGLSLEELARLVDSSKSTLSRLENNDIPQPFKGSMRKLVINLAEILCTSRKETERYLHLAEINRTLLTETEEFQLGFTPHLVAGSPEETANLERWEHMYEQLIKQLEEQETKLGIGNSPPSLKTRLQEYSNTLQEIQHRLNRLHNKQITPEQAPVQMASPHPTTVIEGRIVVGYKYGEEINASSLSNNLYALASPNANRLMQLANVDCFAVDDLIVLTNSNNFAGWTQDDIVTTALSTPLPIPNDVEELRQEKLPAIEKNFHNSSHYKLYSYTPAFSDRKGLEVTLAPIGFHDYYTLIPVLDEPFLTNLDGSKTSIRQKYGNTAFTYSSTDHGASLIPAPVCLECVLITQDQQIVLMQRSFSVALYPNHWSASFEETMDAPGRDPKGNPSRTGDADFFACAIRGLKEEFGISPEAVESIKILSLNIEYLTLVVGVVATIEVNLTAEEVKMSWLLKAADKNEASKFATLPTNLTTVVDKLFNQILWHPTARMRLIQFLFHRYGVDEVAKAIKARKETQRA